MIKISFCGFVALCAPISAHASISYESYVNLLTEVQVYAYYGSEQLSERWADSFVVPAEDEIRLDSGGQLPQPLMGIDGNAAASLEFNATADRFSYEASGATQISLDDAQISPGWQASGFAYSYSSAAGIFRDSAPAGRVRFIIDYELASDMPRSEYIWFFADVWGASPLCPDCSRTVNFSHEGLWMPGHEAGHWTSNWIDYDLASNVSFTDYVVRFNFHINSASSTSYGYTGSTTSWARLNIEFAPPIPEPQTYALLCFGVAATALAVRRRQA